MIEFSKRFVCKSKEICTENNHVNAPAFRKSFTVNSGVDLAEILICGLGFYDLFVNGEKITKGFLAPYISNPQDVVYYDLYDIKKHLQTGENVIGVVLGNGMNNPMTRCWDFCDAEYKCSPRLALSCLIKTKSQTIEFDATDFLCSNSPITFDNLRYGVRYDARKEQDGWCQKGFDDSNWTKPILAEIPKGTKKLCSAEPIVVKQQLKSVNFYKGELADFSYPKGFTHCHVGYPSDQSSRSGGYIYDFGKNTAGVFRFKINNAKKGQIISFQCGEFLDKDGKLDYSNIHLFPDGYDQRDIYVCKGDEQEIFVPMFTYHGCRYVYVHGLTEEQATKDTLTFLVMYSDVQNRATFNCSDSTVNKLWQAVQNSDLSNLYYFPTDCPHREKNGWTGDAAASAERMIMCYSVENCFREWLNNIRVAQNDKGALPGIVPTAGWGFDWGNGPAWDRVLFDLPYEAYVYRGDTQIIKENSRAMIKYLKYIEGRLEDNLTLAIGLGDWAPVGEKESEEYTTPLAFTDTVMVYDMCAKSGVMFDAIGNKSDREYVKKLGDKVKRAIINNFIDLDSCLVKCKTPTAQAMAIYYDIFSDNEKQLATHVLVDLLHLQDDSIIDMGYLGLRVVFHVLARYGYNKLAYKMIMKKQYPSYAYYIEKGFTSLPENFRKETKRCSSLNHHFFGDVNQYFLRYVLGINVNPNKNDPNSLLIKPCFVDELDFAEGSYTSPKGEICLKWQRIGQEVVLNVRCEKGVKYTVTSDENYIVCKTNQSNVFRFLPVKLKG